MVDELNIITELLLKYISGRPLEELEMLRLQSWLEESPDNVLLFEQMQREEWLEDQLLEIEQVDKDKIWAPVAAHIEAQQTEPIRKMTWYKYTAAAAIFLFLICGWIFVARRSNKPPVSTVKKVAPAPVTYEQPVLTLADGSKIILDEEMNGVVARQGKADVIKQDHKVEYRTSEHTSAVASPTVENKLTVPCGQTYQLQLPDGTQVWMNSGSSLEYPAIFTEKNREVTLNGEAYFEVAQDANHPFRVRANDQIVTALGTSFNIRWYVKERSVRTTLETGNVSVSKGSKSIDLEPGQQARTDSGASDISVIKNMNIDGVLSWKKGYFHFDDMDIPSAVYELARWYKLEVDIRKGIPDGPLSIGNIQRSLPLDSLVENLNLQRKDLHIKLIGKTITVTP